MKIAAYVVPAEFADRGRLSLDEHNVTEPCKIYSGHHAGKMFLDAALAEREPLWIPLFRPLIADPSLGVKLVELDSADIQPKELL